MGLPVFDSVGNVGKRIGCERHIAVSVQKCLQLGSDEGIVFYDHDLIRGHGCESFRGVGGDSRTA